VATFSDAGLGSGGTIDLGGGTQTIGRLIFQQQTNPAFYTLTNGTLITTSVEDNAHYLKPSNGPDVVSANLTTTGSILNVGGLSQLLVTGVIGGNGGAGRNDFSLEGGNTTLTNAETYTGNTLVTGALSFAGNNGAAVNSGEYDLLGGSLVLDNSDGINANRLNDSAPVSARFGSFSLIGNSSSAVVETAGQFNLNGAAAQLEAWTNGADATMRFQGINRSVGSTLNLVLSNVATTGKASVLLNSASSIGPVGGGGAAGTSTINILPYAVSYAPNGVSFVTYDPGPDGIAGSADDIGLRPLNLSSEYSSSITSGTTTANNVRITSGANVTSNTAINSLVVSDGSITISPNTRLTLSSGAVAMDTSGSQLTAFNGGAGSVLDFGNGEAIFHTSSLSPSQPQTYTVNAAIQAGNGLTKSGPGTLVLGASNSISGDLRISQGEVVIAAPNALPSGAISFLGQGTSLGFSSYSQSVNNPIQFNNSVTIGNISSSVSTPFFVDSGIAVSLQGSSTGFGIIQKRGAGTLRLNGASLPSIDVEEGSLVVNGATAGDFFDLVNAGILSGTGTLNGNLLVSGGATLSPGDPLGTLTVTNLFGINTAAVIRFEIDGTSQYSQLRFKPEPLLLFQIGGILDVNLGYTPQPGDSFVLVDDDFTGPQYGRFTNLPEGATFTADGTEFQITYQGGDGNDVVITAVPEPAAFALASCLILALRRRRRVA